MFAGTLLVILGTVLAAAAFLLYLVFSGLFPGTGVVPDDIVASTNLLVLFVGVGMVCAGIGWHVSTGPGRSK